MNADEIKNQFNDNMTRYDSAVLYSKGSVVGILKKACRMNDGDYRLVLKALTGKTSSKEITEEQFYALYKFVQPVKPEGSKWQSGKGDDELQKECDALVRSSVDVPDQTRFVI